MSMNKESLYLIGMSALFLLAGLQIGFGIGMGVCP